MGRSEDEHGATDVEDARVGGGTGRMTRPQLLAIATKRRPEPWPPAPLLADATEHAEGAPTAVADRKGRPEPWPPPLIA